MRVLVSHLATGRHDYLVLNRQCLPRTCVYWDPQTIRVHLDAVIYRERMAGGNPGYRRGENSVGILVLHLICLCIPPEEIMKQSCNAMLKQLEIILLITMIEGLAQNR